MSRTIRSFGLLIVFLFLLLAPFVFRYLGHYRLFGREDRPELPVYAPAESVNAVATPQTNEFIDEPRAEGSGFVLLDTSHANFLEDKDVTYLDSRLSLRGYQLIRFGSGDLATALRGVTAFVVIAPMERFNAEEIAAVRDFVERGGRLLLVGDPTRFNLIFSEDLFSFTYTVENDDIALNSLANEFDIIFNGDYLYNTAENEGNFRNILINGTGLGESDLTEDLEQLAFYGAHSLIVGRSGRTLLTADDNTASSATDRPGNLALAVMSADDRVLALGDIDFLATPYYTSFDNSQFVARIADFLVAAEARQFVIRDFPFFYDNAVDLVYAGEPDLGPDAFDEIIELQHAFQNVNIKLTLAAAADNNNDTLYLGLYNQAENLADILSKAGITLSIDPAITPEEDEDDATPTPANNDDDDEENGTIRQIQSALGNVQMSGTALLLLDESGDQQRVIILAASKEGLENTADRLLDLMPLNADYALADCLVQDKLALCPSGVTDEEVEAELDTGGIPEPIIIDGGDDGGDTGDIDELGAIRQGTIGLDDSVDGSLGEGESHSWVFNEGPAIVDIMVEGSNLDGVLELYDSNYDLLEIVDETFSGDPEELIAIEIPDSDNYYIVVRDYFGDPTDYTLSVTESDSEPGETSGETAIFVFVDDDGEAQAGGITSGEAIADILGDTYPVTVWTSSVDGSLDEEILTNYTMIIWDSGDYRTTDAFLDEDTLLLVSYVFDNGIPLIIFGATPPLFDFAGAEGELVALSDIEAVGTEAVLMDGIEVGDVFELDQTYDVVVIPEEDIDTETDIIVFRGGPDSPDASFVSAAVNEEVSIFFLFAPFTALPDDLQGLLLTNIVTWMGY